MRTGNQHAEVAFAEFFDAEFAGQFRRAVFLLRDRGAAEDIVHDAFVEVWRRWQEIAEPGPYLSRCVLNGCRDHAKIRRRRWAHDRSARVEHYDAASADELYDVLARLPFNQRCAVVLRFYVGMSNDEIAHAMGCPVGSVGPWIQRAKQQLLKELT
jgi:RNA polymerase sigma factor (sigma-70 family)